MTTSEPVDLLPFWHCRNCGHSYAPIDFTYPPLPEHLAKTNDAPLTAELEALDTMLSTSSVGIAQELATLDGDIKSLTRTLEALVKRREELELRLTACKSIPSSLRRVPPEIITKIIDWATAGKPVTLDTDDTIWACSRVCQMWRSIALSTPRFWSTICIRVSPEDTIPEERVQTILSRAKNHPLSFEFSFDPFLASSHYAARISLGEFVRHASKWRQVSLAIPPDFLPILSPVRNHIPILESLYLSLHPVNTPEPIPPVKYFRNAPALHKVALDSDLMHPKLLPWSQITEYAPMDGYRIEDAMECLKLMPNLLALDLDLPYIPDQIQVVELWKLRRLRVFMSKNILRLLTLPSLQELVVSIYSGELNPVTDLIKRSQCHITTLGISTDHGLAISDTIALVELLECLPALHVLDLSQLSMKNMFIFCNLLVPATTESAPPLPALTELTLPSIQDDIDDFDKVVPFLQQRRNGNRPIESVVFSGYRESLSPEFESLQQDGLRISFTADTCSWIFSK